MDDNQNNFYFEDSIYEDDNTYVKCSIKKKLAKNKIRIIVIISLIIALITLLIMFLSYLFPDKLTSFEMDPSKTNILYMGSYLTINEDLESNKHIDKAVTTFFTENEYVIDIETEKASGKAPTTTIIPLQEGVANVNIETTIKRKHIKSDKQSIIVCPSFDKNLVFSNRIAVTRGSKYNLNIDFGEGICSKDIIYSSSNNNIFSITNDGIINGVSTGTANLTIIKDGKVINVPVDVVNTKIPVANINTDVSHLDLVMGQNYRLNTSYKPYNATNVNISFKSSDENVLFVNNRGFITTNNAGSAKIIVSSGNIKKEIDVFVENMYEDNLPVSDIILNDILTIEKGKSQRINYYTLPRGSSSSKTGWITEDNNIISVLRGGVIYAKEVGIAKVTAINEDIEKSIIINVVE